MSAPVTPLPWRGSEKPGVIVADGIPDDEVAVGLYARASADSIAYYGGVIVCESMLTADVEYAVRAVNEYEALLDIFDAAKHFLREDSEACATALDAAFARLGAVRSGASLGGEAVSREARSLETQEPAGDATRPETSPSSTTPRENGHS